MQTWKLRNGCKFLVEKNVGIKRVGRRGYFHNNKPKSESRGVTGIIQIFECEACE